MNYLDKVKKQLHITRAKMEILSVIIILVCGLSVLSVTVTSKTSLTYDKGQIKYTGYVLNHKMNGQGKLVYSNGDTYDGQFKNGVFEGKGTFTASNGWSYSGQFKAGQADGKGVLKAKNAKVYKGTFKQGIFQK
ncbi:MORN repeat-containing protein [Streptococcus ictaluri]|uniref:MORN repeat protein n=1 Tax=Streptococcus ictaluri 707-05 TaxID=764299 RepID=G5K5E2_9STRE|nr:MORN repeat-containing protein [Streptococcus ictaluri]EHI69277.1 MORN repeat protein [Streptococcus ictaluri 707-05]